jgi:hypothetical protein
LCLLVVAHSGERVLRSDAAAVFQPVVDACDVYALLLSLREKPDVTCYCCPGGARDLFVHVDFGDF